MATTYKKLKYDNSPVICDMTNNYKIKTSSAEQSTKYISNMFTKRLSITLTNPTADSDTQTNLICSEFACGDGTYAPGSSDCWRCFANVVGTNFDGAYCTYFKANAIHSTNNNLKVWLTCLRPLSGTITVVIDVLCVKTNIHTN